MKTPHRKVSYLPQPGIKPYCEATATVIPQTVIRLGVFKLLHTTVHYHPLLISMVKVLAQTIFEQMKDKTLRVVWKNRGHAHLVGDYYTEILF